MKTIGLIRQEYSPSGGAEIFIGNFARALSAFMNCTLIHGGRPWPGLETIEQIALPAQGLTRVGKKKSFFRSVHSFLAAHHFDITQSHERVPGANIYRLGDGVHAAWLNYLNKSQHSYRNQLRKIDPFHKFILSTEKEIFAQPHSIFIAISELVKSDILEFYKVPEHQIKVITNGVDTNYFRPPSVYEARAARDLLKVPFDAPVICFVGSDFKRKGLTELLLAVEDLPEYHVVVAGHDKQFESAIKHAEMHGISNRVRFTGPTSDVRSVFWASDLFVLPSLYDPFANAALEAAACGLPCALTRATGFAHELIELNKAGLEITRNRDSIRFAIEELYSRRVELGPRSVQVARLKHLESSLIQWKQLYQTSF
jgi:UDP-glucose:(heptosyl)LPS alpha-1,3-glucosyltransferase